MLLQPFIVYVVQAPLGDFPVLELAPIFDHLLLLLLGRQVEFSFRFSVLAIDEYDDEFFLY